MKKLEWADLPNLKSGQKLWYSHANKQGVVKAIVRVLGPAIEFSIPVEIIKIIEATGINSNLQLGFRYLTVKELHFLEEKE